MSADQPDYIDKFLRTMQNLVDKPGASIDRITIKFDNDEVEVAKHNHLWHYPRPWPSGGFLTPAAVAVESQSPSAAYAVCRKCGRRGDQTEPRERLEPPPHDSTSGPVSDPFHEKCRTCHLGQKPDPEWCWPGCPHTIANPR